MKKIVLFSIAVICLTLTAFVARPVASVEVNSISDPFTNRVDICYTLPYEGDVDITITCEGSQEKSGEYVDKQGHGTHCAGIACASGPTGTYRVDFRFDGDLQTFYIQRR